MIPTYILSLFNYLITVYFIFILTVLICQGDKCKSFTPNCNIFPSRSISFKTVFWVLNLTDEIKEEIMNGKSSIEVRKKALEGDYRPLIIDGINKVIQGYTTLSELNKKLLIY